jgi:hypothetical protein
LVSVSVIELPLAAKPETVPPKPSVLGSVIEPPEIPPVVIEVNAGG